jgi:MFS family permease
MTGATSVPLTSWRQDIGVASCVSVAHAFSHFFQLGLPLLFPFLRDAFGLSWAELGFTQTVFYGVSGLMQTPGGYAVDRFGPRMTVTGGLLAASLAILLSACATSYLWLLLAAVIGGIGNSVFHPGDLTLLNQKIDPRRLGYAFSVHNVGGNLGWVISPLVIPPLAVAFGWRWSLAAVGMAGLVWAAFFVTRSSLAASKDGPGTAGRSAVPRTTSIASLRALVTPAVLMCFFFYMMIAMALTGFNNFAPSALQQVYPIDYHTAASAITFIAIGGIAGTLLGGVVAVRATHHNRVAFGGIVAAAFFAAVIATGMAGTAVVLGCVAAIGFFVGITNPSRDTLVREIAPAHARGRVYGFVYSGLDAGAALAPVVLGFLLDHDLPRWVFAGSALCLLVAAPAVLELRRRPGEPG